MANGIAKPLCGGTAGGDTRFWVFVGIAGGAVGVIGGLVTAFDWIVKPAEHIIFTAGPYAFTAAIVASAAAGALLTAGFVWAMALDRLSSRDGLKACYAGVVTNIVGAFSSASDYFFPYTAQHDRSDVVVKPSYWNLVTLPPSEWVWCNSDSLQSPMIRSYYYTSEIEGAAIGSMIGAGVGAVGGFVLGLLAGVAIGCAGGPLLCLLAMLVALIVAAVVVLIAAAAGGGIGAAAAGSSAPSGTPAGGGGSQDLGTGDYVSVNANLVVYPEDKNAVVAWWVENTTVHGRSVVGEGAGGTAPFSFTDPRDNLEPDACPVITDKTPPPPR